MKPLVFLLLFIILSITSLGAIADIKPLTPYIDGASACQAFEKTVHGERISVPIQYDQPTNRKTSLFYWFLEPFDAQKKTLIYVSGGPGVSSHSIQDQFESLRQEFNILQFHQRGVYCSRPETAELIDSNEYYSSEWTARDMEVIRKHLHISKWIVWGHSYGTVPATIFGHLFPAVTQNVILESVIDEGSRRLWEIPSRRKNLHQFYRNLSMEMRAKIDLYSRHSDLDPRWFSILSYNFSYYQDSEKMLFESLQALFQGTEESILEGLKDFRPSEAEKKDEIEVGHYAWTILTCKEFSAFEYGTNHFFSVENGEFIPDLKTALGRRECEERGLLKSKFYQAKDYVLNVPVTYLNGLTDGATAAENALRHYEKTPRSFAQILLVEDSGHTPFNDLNQNGEFGSLFEKILRGGLLSFQEVLAWNSQSSRQIQFKFKAPVSK